MTSEPTSKWSRGADRNCSRVFETWQQSQYPPLSKEVLLETSMLSPLPNGCSEIHVSHAVTMLHEQTLLQHLKNEPCCGLQLE